MGILRVWSKSLIKDYIYSLLHFWWRNIAINNGSTTNLNIEPPGFVAFVDGVIIRLNEFIYICYICEAPLQLEFWVATIAVFFKNIDHSSKTTEHRLLLFKITYKSGTADRQKFDRDYRVSFAFFFWLF